MYQDTGGILSTLTVTIERPGTKEIYNELSYIQARVDKLEYKVQDIIIYKLCTVCICRSQARTQATVTGHKLG